MPLNFKTGLAGMNVSPLSQPQTQPDIFEQFDPLADLKKTTKELENRLLRKTEEQTTSQLPIIDFSKMQAPVSQQPVYGQGATSVPQLSFENVVQQSENAQPAPQETSQQAPIIPQANAKLYDQAKIEDFVKTGREAGLSNEILSQKLDEAMQTGLFDIAQPEPIQEQPQREPFFKDLHPDESIGEQALRATYRAPLEVAKGVVKGAEQFVRGGMNVSNKLVGSALNELTGDNVEIPAFLSDEDKQAYLNEFVKKYEEIHGKPPEQNEIDDFNKTISTTKWKDLTDMTAGITTAMWNALKAPASLGLGLASELPGTQYGMQAVSKGIEKGAEALAESTGMDTNVAHNVITTGMNTLGLKGVKGGTLEMARGAKTGFEKGGIPGAIKSIGKEIGRETGQAVAMPFTMPLGLAKGVFHPIETAKGLGQNIIDTGKAILNPVETLKKAGLPNNAPQIQNLNKAKEIFKSISKQKTGGRTTVPQIKSQQDIGFNGGVEFVARTPDTTGDVKQVVEVELPQQLQEAYKGYSDTAKGSKTDVGAEMEVALKEALLEEVSKFSPETQRKMLPIVREILNRFSGVDASGKKQPITMETVQNEIQLLNQDTRNSYNNGASSEVMNIKKLAAKTAVDKANELLGEAYGGERGAYSSMKAFADQVKNIYLEKAKQENIPETQVIDTLGNIGFGYEIMRHMTNPGFSSVYAALRIGKTGLKFLNNPERQFKKMIELIKSSNPISTGLKAPKSETPEATQKNTVETPDVGIPAINRDIPKNTFKTLPSTDIQTPNADIPAIQRRFPLLPSGKSSTGEAKTAGEGQVMTPEGGSVAIIPANRYQSQKEVQKAKIGTTESNPLSGLSQKTEKPVKDSSATSQDNLTPQEKKRQENKTIQAKIKGQITDSENPVVTMDGENYKVEFEGIDNTAVETYVGDYKVEVDTVVGTTIRDGNTVIKAFGKFVRVPLSTSIKKLENQIRLMEENGMEHNYETNRLNELRDAIKQEETGIQTTKDTTPLQKTEKPVEETTVPLQKSDGIVKDKDVLNDKMEMDTLIEGKNKIINDRIKDIGPIETPDGIQFSRMNWNTGEMEIVGKLSDLSPKTRNEFLAAKNEYDNLKGKGKGEAIMNANERYINAERKSAEEIYAKISNADKDKPSLKAETETVKDTGEKPTTKPTLQEIVTKKQEKTDDETYINREFDIVREGTKSHGNTRNWIVKDKETGLEVSTNFNGFSKEDAIKRILDAKKAMGDEFDKKLQRGRERIKQETTQRQQNQDVTSETPKNEAEKIEDKISIANKITEAIKNGENTDELVREFNDVKKESTNPDYTKPFILPKESELGKGSAEEVVEKTKFKEESPTTENEQSIKKIDLLKTVFGKDNVHRVTDESTKVTNKEFTTNTTKNGNNRQEEVSTTVETKPETSGVVSGKNAGELNVKNQGNGTSEPGTGPTNGLGGLNLKGKTTRAKLNEEVKSILESKGYSDKVSDYTKEEIDKLREYTGAGGKGDKGATGRGLLDEYYTPKEVVDSMWELAKSNGLPDNAKILEPSAGVGRFLEKAPEGADVKAYELDKVSGTILKLLYPESKSEIRDFQTIFSDRFGKKQDVKPEYDLVIGNPPYGTREGYYKGVGEEAKIGKWDEYFIKRGLDLTKDGGLLVYIVPSSFLSGKNSIAKDMISKNSTLVDAYRMPEGIFEDTQVGTDIIVLRKGTGENPDMFTDGSFFKENPDKIMGEVIERTNRFGRKETAVVKTGDGTPTKKISENIKKNPLLGLGKTKVKTESPKNDPNPTTSGTPNKIRAPRKPQEKKIVDVSGIKTVERQILNSETATEAEIEIFKNQNNDLSVNIGKDMPISWKPYLNYEKGKWFHDINYFSGDIRDKISALELVKDDLSPEQYAKQKAGLEKVLPTEKKITEITFDPLDRNIMFREINGTVIRNGFGDYIRELSHRAIGHNVEKGDILRYIDGDRQRKDTKPITGYIKSEAKRFFNQYLQNNLPSEIQDVIVKEYNEQKNSYVRPEYKNIPVEIKGMATHYKGNEFSLTDTQKQGVGFLTNKGTGLLAYGVGVGKTHSLLISTVANMQKGYSKRPLFIVPSSTLDTWIKTTQEMFPGIKVNNLKGLQAPVISRLKASGDVKDWIKDGEITFTTIEGILKLGFSDAELYEATKDLNDALGTFDKDISPRSAEQNKEKTQAILGASLRGATDINISDLGIDHISVDEVHNFRKVFQGAKTEEGEDGAKGKRRFGNVFGGTPSKQAQKLFLLSQHIQRNNNGRNVFLASATPFENHATEIYNVLSFMARDRLKKMGIYNINDFYTSFANFRTDLVQSVDGQFQDKEVMTSFSNLKELQSLIKEFIDKKEDDTLVRPDKRVLAPQLKMSPLQAEIKGKIQSMLSSDDPGVILKATTYLKSNSVSPYFIKEFSPTPKDVNEFVDNSPKIKYALEMIKTLHENESTKSRGSFLYIGKEGVGFTKYYEEWLVKNAGYKPSEIEVIAGDRNNTPDSRDTVMRRFNNGEVKVLIGGDATKEGINLQNNGYATINIALGWNPTEMQQVEGRVWRQGNNLNHALVVYPLVENSGDINIYQKFEEKASRINDLFSYEGTTFDTGELDPKQKKLLLLTDPVEKANLNIKLDSQRLQNDKLFIDSDIAELKTLSSSLSEKQYRYESAVREIAGSEAMLEIADSESKKEYYVQRIKSYKDEQKKFKQQIESIKERLNKRGIDDIPKKIKELEQQSDEMNHQIAELKNTFTQLVERYTQEEIENLKNTKTIEDHKKDILQNVKDLVTFSLEELKAKKSELVNKKNPLGGLGKK